MSAPLPWSGSRARSRDRGYAQAMYEIARLADDLRQPGMDPAAALAGLGRLALETGMLYDWPVLTPAAIAGTDREATP